MQITQKSHDKTLVSLSPCNHGSFYPNIYKVANCESFVPGIFCTILLTMSFQMDYFYSYGLKDFAEYKASNWTVNMK